MLSALKQKIREEATDQMGLEYIAESDADNRLKDSLLDDLGFATLGAEDDPKVKELVDGIPEYDDKDPELEKTIKESVEEIPES